MANIPLLCCPQPAFNALHPHEIPDEKREEKVPVTPGLSCSNPLFVTNCGSVVPPEPILPITLDGQDCDGAANPATGMPGELVQIVQAPGQVLSVRFCSDDAADFELACGVDPATGHQIQTAYKIVAGEFVLIKRWDTVTGAEWTGDASTLEGCGGAGLESDPQQVCVDGQSLTQWIVKKDGIPNGTAYYTDASGALVVIDSTAIIVQGGCVTQCASLPIQDCDNVIYGYAFDASSAAAVGATVALEDCDGVVYGYIFPASGAGHTKPVYEGCAPDPQVLIGYAADIGCATDVVQESDAVPVCIDGVSATQWVIKENGVPTGVVHYTDAEGQLFVPAAGAVVVLGSCPAAACDPTISSATADTLAGLLPGNSISIQKNNCCSIKVKTSAGDFIVSKDVTGYSTGDFNCDVTVTGVEVLSGTCSLADVIVTTQKAG